MNETMSDTTREDHATMLAELLDDKNFAVYLEYIRSKLMTAAQLLPPKITTEEEKSDYNYQRGFIAGLKLACDLPEHLIEQAHKKV